MNAVFFPGEGNLELEEQRFMMRGKISQEPEGKPFKQMDVGILNMPSEEVVEEQLSKDCLTTTWFGRIWAKLEMGLA